MSSILKAPFPWFGGKSKVSAQVWDMIGDVRLYVEPFAGSLAVLLGRPEWHTGYTETVNDKDMYLANFWRAVKGDPEKVAYYANNPVNEADLTARHIWLVNSGLERIERLQGDPDYYDTKVAGWWVWGICCWIGSGWCAGNSKWGSSVDGRLINLRESESAGKGVNRKLVHLGSAGAGVNRQLVHLGNAGQGVNRRLVHLGDAGRGVNRKRVHLGNAGQGVNRKTIHAGGAECGVDTGLEPLIEWMTRLAERLRYVRVCCGDWQRVITDGALSHGRDNLGIFFDPPYDNAVRSKGIYNHDEVSLAGDVRRWCLENGTRDGYHIVLAGYDNEDNSDLITAGWGVYRWTAGRAYGNANGKSANAANREREILLYNPACERHKVGIEVPRLEGI